MGLAQSKSLADYEYNHVVDMISQAIRWNHHHAWIVVNPNEKAGRTYRLERYPQFEVKLRKVDWPLKHKKGHVEANHKYYHIYNNTHKKGYLYDATDQKWIDTLPSDDTGKKEDHELHEFIERWEDFYEIAGEGDEQKAEKLSGALEMEGGGSTTTSDLLSQPDKVNFAVPSEQIIKIDDLGNYLTRIPDSDEAVMIVTDISYDSSTWPHQIESRMLTTSDLSNIYTLLDHYVEHLSPESSLEVSLDATGNKLIIKGSEHHKTTLTTIVGVGVKDYYASLRRYFDSHDITIVPSQV